MQSLGGGLKSLSFGYLMTWKSVWILSRASRDYDRAGNGVGVVMTKLVAAGAALASLIIGPALAADMPAKAPLNRPIYDWTGCYAGFNIGAGYAEVRDDWTPNPAGFATVAIADIVPMASRIQRPGGFVGGGQVGCNYQTGIAVWGLEGDFDYSGVKASLGVTTPAFNNSITESVKSTWISTARARVGFTNGAYNWFGNWLLYFTGGAAFANLQLTDLIVFPATATSNVAFINQTKAGWTVGGGIEWVTFGSWTIKAEGLYVDLGRISSTSFNNNPAFATSTILHDHRFSEYIARLGANYRFGYSPVVAAY
jgi:outer membrane immunogenic protein